MLVSKRGLCVAGLLMLVVFPLASVHAQEEWFDCNTNQKLLQSKGLDGVQERCLRHKVPATWDFSAAARKQQSENAKMNKNKFWNVVIKCLSGARNEEGMERMIFIAPSVLSGGEVDAYLAGTYWRINGRGEKRTTVCTSTFRGMDPHVIENGKLGRCEDDHDSQCKGIFVSKERNGQLFSSNKDLARDFMFSLKLVVKERNVKSLFLLSNALGNVVLSAVYDHFPSYLQKNPLIKGVVVDGLSSFFTSPLMYFDSVISSTDVTKLIPVNEASEAFTSFMEMCQQDGICTSLLSKNPSEFVKRIYQDTFLTRTHCQGVLEKIPLLKEHLEATFLDPKEDMGFPFAVSMLAKCTEKSLYFLSRSFEKNIALSCEGKEAKKQSLDVLMKNLKPQVLSYPRSARPASSPSHEWKAVFGSSATAVDICAKKELADYSTPFPNTDLVALPVLLLNGDLNPAVSNTTSRDLMASLKRPYLSVMLHDGQPGGTTLRHPKAIESLHNFLVSADSQQTTDNAMAQDEKSTLTPSSEGPSSVGVWRNLNLNSIVTAITALLLLGCSGCLIMYYYRGGKSKQGGYEILA
eukprot:Nk52_evm71s217 gene=Nk52_evmTU71s217